MSISTFVGLQTSLRGLLAQQRALDVTSHNIANASTVGYSRQEVNLAATQPLNVNAGGIGQRRHARHGRRRPELPPRPRPVPRPPVPRAEHAARRPDRPLGRAAERRALASPSRATTASRTRSTSSSAPGRTSRTAPSSGAAKQAVIDKSRTLAQQINDLQGNLASARQAAADEYTQTAGAGGQINQMANDLATTLNAIRSAEMTGAQPNDLLRPPRPPARPAVDDGPGLDDAVGRRQLRRQPRRRDDRRRRRHDRHGLGPGRRVPLTYTTSPGGKLGALLDLQSSTGPIASFQTDLAAVAQSLAVVGQQRLQRRDRHGLLHVRHGRRRPAADQPQRARRQRHDARGRHRRPRRQLRRARRLPPAGRRRRRALQAARDADGQRRLDGRAARRPTPRS